jgi:hypothetical protein
VREKEKENEGVKWKRGDLGLNLKSIEEFREIGGGGILSGSEMRSKRELGSEVKLLVSGN